MTSSQDRPAPIGAYLALVAGLVALASIALPWFRFDEAAFSEAMQGVVQRVTADAASGLTPSETEQIRAIGTSATQAASSELRTLVDDNLHGYQDGIVWILMRIVAIGGAFVAAVKVMNGEVSGASQRGALVGTGVLLAVRPVLLLVHTPFDDPRAKEFGLVMSDIVPFATGFYVALFAAVLMVGAGLLAHLGDEESIPEFVEHTTPMPPGMPVSQPYMPAQPVAAAAAPSPATHVPWPYLPPAPAMAQPLAMPPAYDPSPYIPAAATAQQGATATHRVPTSAGVPITGRPPADPQAHDAPRRSASVAPPGT